MSKDSSDKKKRLAVAGAAGLTPFAGLIGDTKKLNPMSGQRFATSSDLARQAQKGDVLMAGAPGKTLSGGFNKTFINLGIGKPSGYHPTIVEGVTPDGRLTVLEQGPDKGWQRKTLAKDSHASLSLLRQKSPENAAKTVDTARRYVMANENLGRELMKRGLPEEEVLRIQKQAYSHRMNPTIGFRELFLPKGRDKRSAATQRAGADDALRFFEQNTGQIADNLAAKSKAGKKITLSDLKCLGGVCTTTAAKAGVPVRAGTNLNYASPNDILASKQLKNVGYKRAANAGNLGQRALHGVLRHGPNLVRGAAGLGIGALAYQGAKKVWPGEQKTAGVLDTVAPRTLLELVKVKSGVADKLDSMKTTKKDVHNAATKAGMSWDNDPSFMAMSKSITGKSHLDDMSPAELHKMKRVIQSRGLSKTAKPTIANQGENYTGNIAAGTAGAGLMAPKAIEPMLGKDVTRYKPGKPIHIYYTDPERGRGHYQQAKNIARSLEQKGIPHKLINVEEKFTTPHARQQLIDTYKRVMNGELSHGAWKKEWTKFYLTQVDKSALKADAKGAGGVILTNPGIAPWMRGSMPANIVVSDPSKAMIDTPLGTSWTRAQDTKYVPESIKDGYKGPNVKRITNVPLDPDMFDRRGPNPFDPKRSHVTVSGGGTGTDVVKQVEQLLGSKTREIKGKPLTVHAITGTLEKHRPADYKRLLQMAQESGGRLVVHSDLPHDKLRPMLQSASANIMRPHGTMGTEAVVANKPMILSARGGIGGDGKARFAGGMNTSNALKFQEMTGAPMAGTGGQTTRANLGQIFDKHAPKLDDLQKGVGEAASKFSDTAGSITDDIIKRPKIHAPGRIPFSKQMAMAGGVLAGGAGLHALYKKYKGKKEKPMKKISMRVAWNQAERAITQFEPLDMDALRDESYARGLTKAAAAMGLIKTANVEMNYAARKARDPKTGKIDQGKFNRALGVGYTSPVKSYTNPKRNTQTGSAQPTHSKEVRDEAARLKAYMKSSTGPAAQDKALQDKKIKNPTIAPASQKASFSGGGAGSSFTAPPASKANPTTVSQPSGNPVSNPPKVKPTVPKPNLAPAPKASKPIPETSTGPNTSVTPDKILPQARDAGDTFDTGGNRNRGAWTTPDQKPRENPYLGTGLHTQHLVAKSQPTSSNPAPRQQSAPAVAKQTPKGDFNINMKAGKGYGWLANQLKSKGVNISHKDLRKRMGDQMLYRNKGYTFNPSEFGEGAKGLVSGRRGEAKDITKRVSRAQRGMRQWEGGGRAKFLAARKAKADAAKADAAKPTVKPATPPTYGGPGLRSASAPTAKATAPIAPPPVTDELAGSPTHVASKARATLPFFTKASPAQTKDQSATVDRLVASRLKSKGIAGPKVETAAAPTVPATKKPTVTIGETKILRRGPKPTKAPKRSLLAQSNAGVFNSPGNANKAVIKNELRGEVSSGAQAKLKAKGVEAPKVAPAAAKTPGKPVGAANLFGSSENTPNVKPTVAGKPTGAVDDTKGGKPIVAKKPAEVTPTPLKPNPAAPTVTRQDSDVNTPGVNTRTRGSTSVARDGNRTVTTTRSSTSGNVSVASLKAPQRKAYQGMQVSLNKAIGVGGNMNLKRTMASMAMTQALAKGWDPSTGAAGWEKADPRGYKRMKKKYPAAFAK